MLALYAAQGHPHYTQFILLVFSISYQTLAIRIYSPPSRQFQAALYGITCEDMDSLVSWRREGSERIRNM